MRIISGKFKGKKILEPNDLNTRPLKDLTKESIFNIIQHSNKFRINFENAEILDLFSGTGSFGIECISRGAKFVDFVENYEEILPILKRNLTDLNSRSNYSNVATNNQFSNDYITNFCSNNTDRIIYKPGTNSGIKGSSKLLYLNNSVKFYSSI